MGEGPKLVEGNKFEVSPKFVKVLVHLVKSEIENRFSILKVKARPKGKIIPCFCLVRFPYFLLALFIHHFIISIYRSKGQK